MNMTIRGSCENFCPDAEAKMRIREKLLNYYELKDGQKHVPGVLVKEFARSAADAKMPKAKDMRSERCLAKTVEYLLKDILMDTRRPYHWAYDFIFDRLRMVRREIVIQQFDAKQTIRLLEPICMFLAFSSYKLCAENIEKYDPKICHQHLQECLNVVLCCYKQLDEEQQKQKMEATLLELQRRCFIESLYQVFNMGTSEALMRALTLPAQVREDDNFKRTFGMCLEYHRGNLYRVIVAIPQLPHILCALAALKLQIIRRRLLEILNVAYSNKQLTVPSSYLLRLTLCTTAVLVDQCRHYNIALTPDRQMVHFSKTEFNRNVDTLKSTQESFVDAKFARIYLPEVLLLKKLWL